MARCHIELYKPGRAPLESRLVLAVPSSPSSLRAMLASGRCSRAGCFVMIHCPGAPEKTIRRHDGKAWRKVR